jgi:hypothetical protein
MRLTLFFYKYTFLYKKTHHITSSGIFSMFASPKEIHFIVQYFHAKLIIIIIISSRCHNVLCRRYKHGLSEMAASEAATKVHEHAAACSSASKLQNLYSRNQPCSGSNPLHTILIGKLFTLLNAIVYVCCLYIHFFIFKQAICSTMADFLV